MMGIQLTNDELWRACGPFPQDSGEAKKAADAATKKVVEEIDRKFADVSGICITMKDWAEFKKEVGIG